MALFHRYQSTIHGPYRRAYLRSGLLMGGGLALYAIVRLLIGRPMPSPVSIVVDVVLIVGIFLLTAWYRQSLPEQKITLKEAMLFGIGTAMLTAVVYGVAVWLMGRLSAAQTLLFTQTLAGQTLAPSDPQMAYWAAWWAIVGAVEMALIGSFGAFLAAILFRNEKSNVKK